MFRQRMSWFQPVTCWFVFTSFRTLIGITCFHLVWCDLLGSDNSMGWLFYILLEIGWWQFIHGFFLFTKRIQNWLLLNRLTMILDGVNQGYIMRQRMRTHTGWMAPGLALDTGYLVCRCLFQIVDFKAVFSGPSIASACFSNCRIKQ